MFLATQSQITSKLKGKLEVLHGYEDLLCEIVDLCCSLYDQKAFILPAEKHMLLKVRFFKSMVGLERILILFSILEVRPHKMRVN